jgi:hypothetical protein
VIPATYDIELYAGDTYYGPLITFPDLSPFGGPPTFESSAGVEVEASLRRTKGTESSVPFTVEVVDEAARQVRLTLPADETEALDFTSGYWDLHVIDGTWSGTPLAGTVSVVYEVTKPPVAVP